MTAGWERRELGELLHLQNGFAFDSKRFGSEGMPLIRIRDLKTGSGTETKFDGGYDERYVVASGDLLIGMDGEFRCYEWHGERALLNQRVCRLQGFSGALLPKFLLYGINSYLKEIEDATGFATVKHLSSKQVLGISFPIPPVQEQQRIVTTLDEAFACIATAKANAKKKSNNASALFKSHLQSEFSHRGDGWSQKLLAEICESARVITYGVVKLGGEVQNGVPCLRTSNVRWLRVETSGMKRIALELSAEYSRTILRGGELLVNVRGTLGGVAVASPEMAGWNVSREVAVVPIDSSRVDPYFLSYLIGSGTSQDWLGGVKKGAAYVGINIEDLRLLPVSIPSLARQREMVIALESVHKQAKNLESLCARKIAALDELKQSLLQQAFSGQL